MELDIEIERTDSPGNTIKIKGTLKDQQEAEEFKRIYGAYFPRKRILDFLRGI
jgi:hypothetical protein